MCKNPLTDPKTLPCLHTFCLACLEYQGASVSSSPLICHVCRTPFAPPNPGGVSSFECNAFIESIAKIVKTADGNVDKVVKCDLCEEADATMHCVEDNENYCPPCSNAHKKSKASASHQQISIEEVLKGSSAAKRIPRCHKHAGLEFDTYCQTCTEALCSKCAISSHPNHAVCQLSQVAGPLQEEIAGMHIAIGKREQTASRAIPVLEAAIEKMQESCTVVEKEIESFFAEMHSKLDERKSELLKNVRKKSDRWLMRKERQR